MSDGTVVTFYSYKGGVGRTFLLANVAAVLSDWGYKVLCVDWDIEAPGLDQYFAPWVSATGPGLVEFIEAHVAGKRPDWRAHIVPVAIPASEGRLSLMRSGDNDGTYLRRVQDLDWKRLFDEYDFGRTLEQVRGEWKKEFDFIFIDSRTGVTDTGGICTVHLPDILVFLFTANNQSLNGVIDVVHRAIEARHHLAVDRAGLLALPIPSRLDTRDEYKLSQQWLDTFAERLAPFYENWIDEKQTPREFLDFTKVPYFSFWSYGEKLPVVEERRTDPDSISYQLLSIAALIARSLEDPLQLVHNRDGYVRAARRSSRSSAEKQTEVLYDIVLDYSKDDRSYAMSLIAALERQGLKIMDLAEGASEETLLRSVGSAIRQSRGYVMLIGGGPLSSASIGAYVYASTESSPKVVLPVVINKDGFNKSFGLINSFSRSVVDALNLAPNEAADLIVERLNAALHSGIAEAGEVRS